VCCALGQVDANLVGTSRLESAFDEGRAIACEPLAHRDPRHRAFAGPHVGRELQTIGTVSAVKRFERGVRRLAHDDGQVRALDVVACELGLQTLPRGFVLCDDQDAARPLVEPVNDARSSVPTGLVGKRRVGDQRPSRTSSKGGARQKTLDERSRRMTPSRMHDEAPRLVDHDEVLVLVEHVEQDVGIRLQIVGSAGRGVMSTIAPAATVCDAEPGRRSTNTAPASIQRLTDVRDEGAPSRSSEATTNLSSLSSGSPVAATNR